MEIYVTTDLRKYISKDKKQSICNLSSMIVANIARIEEEYFEETLDRVAEMVNVLKSDKAGLSSAITMEAIGRVDYAQCVQILQGARKQAIDSKKCSPMLSNVGVIPRLKFGQVDAYDAYIVTPSMYAPGFMLGVSSYNDTLTLVVSHYEPSTSQKDVNIFLNSIKAELESLIR